MSSLRPLEGARLGKSKDETAKALFEQNDIEIHQRPDLEVRQFEIGDYLRVVDGKESVEDRSSTTIVSATRRSMR